MLCTMFFCIVKRTEKGFKLSREIAVHISSINQKYVPKYCIFKLLFESNNKGFIMKQTCLTSAVILSDFPTHYQFQLSTFLLQWLPMAINPSLWKSSPTFQKDEFYRFSARKFTDIRTTAPRLPL